MGTQDVKSNPEETSSTKSVSFAENTSVPNCDTAALQVKSSQARPVNISDDVQITSTGINNELRFLFLPEP